MGDSLSLHNMTTNEKIQTMELLWNDLCQDSESITSPEWHQDILVEREAAVKNGSDTFMDWKDAKMKILNDIS